MQTCTVVPGVTQFCQAMSWPHTLFRYPPLVLDLQRVVSRKVRQEDEQFASAIRPAWMAGIVPQGTGEYASKAHRCLFDLHRAPGPSGDRGHGGMASDSHRRGRGRYAAVLSLVGILAVHTEKGWKGKSFINILAPAWCLNEVERSGKGLRRDDGTISKADSGPRAASRLRASPFWFFRAVVVCPHRWP